MGSQIVVEDLIAFQDWSNIVFETTHYFFTVSNLSIQSLHLVMGPIALLIESWFGRRVGLT